MRWWKECTSALEVSLSGRSDCVGQTAYRPRVALAAMWRLFAHFAAAADQGKGNLVRPRDSRPLAEEFDREHWPEKVDNEIHPHVKPLGLISRLISAITEPGDLVVDPAAGSFVVMRATHELGRDFIGCDIAYQPEARGAERDAA